MYRACPVIHPSAQIHAGADLADDVSVGPYCIIGEHVRIGRGTRIAANVIIEGHTTIGCDNEVHPFSVIGGAPQDKKYAGEATRLEIGDCNTIREFCTINTGTAQDEGVTRIGDDNWIMAYVHLAHDCVVGNHTIFANNSQLAGHVHVGDWVILGGFTVVHQFIKIGAHSMTAMCALLFADLPPFVMCQGQPAQARSMNFEGLRRRGFSADSISAVKAMHKALYRDGLTLEQAKSRIAELPTQHSDAQVVVDLMLGFLAESSPQRGIVR